MWFVRKETLLLLVINALYVHCRTVLLTQNVNETDRFPSLKEDELSNCHCENGECLNVEGKNICKCNPGFGNFSETKCRACVCGPDTNCMWTSDAWPKKICYCKPGFNQKAGTCVACQCKNGECVYEGGTTFCKCNPGYGNYTDSKCEACDCGPNEDCIFIYKSIFTTDQVCFCKPGYSKHDGKCRTCQCENGECVYEGGTTFCKCNPGYGNYTDSKCKACDCGPNEDCIFIYKSIFQTNQVCLCKPGYSNYDGKCRKDPCSSNPCKNDGQCTSEEQGFKCKCSGSWTGETCEEIEMCYKNEDCEDKQKCVEMEDGRQNCECADGLGGAECGILEWCENSEKFLNCKGENGTCEYSKESRAVVCECSQGKQFHPTEKRCKETCVDKNECENGGDCLEKGGHRYCTCKLGLLGDKCRTVYDCTSDGKFKGCESSGGICSYDVNTEKSVCKCSGTNQLDETENKCKECNCGPYGSCIFKDGQKVCNCRPSATEKNGVCIILESTTPESTTDVRTTILPSTTQYCNCGEYSKSCRYSVKGEKICECFHGFSENHGSCDECNCGPYGSCDFKNGQKMCNCKPFATEKNGVCIIIESTTSESTTAVRTTILPSTTQYCNCGEYSKSCHYNLKGEKICECFHGFAENYGSCAECNCGPYGLCDFKNGQKFCDCRPFATEKNGVCIIMESTTLKSTTTSRTTVLPSTTQNCYCGEYSKSCRYNWNGDKICECFPGYAEIYGTCEECNCGPYGSCDFKNGQKFCECRPFATEKNGVCIIMESTTLKSTTAAKTTVLPSTTQNCYCGEYSKSCRYKWNGDKICECFPGYAEKYGICEECYCGPRGSCSFKNGRKKCYCISYEFEIDGFCIGFGTSSKGTTNYISTSTVATSTMQECDCGPLGRCTLESGQKRCTCDPFTSERYGRCVDCSCGKNTKSCHFSKKGDKVCECTSGYAETNGICEMCNCGVKALSCFYRRNGIKVCNCDFGYKQINGYCSAICNEEKCVHGKCEIMGNDFKCRCSKGFTGRRCEIETKSSKPDLWKIMLVAIVFAILILNSAMLCFLRRIRNKMSKK